MQAQATRPARCWRKTFAIQLTFTISPALLVKDKEHPFSLNQFAINIRVWPGYHDRVHEHSRLGDDLLSRSNRCLNRGNITSESAESFPS